MIFFSVNRFIYLFRKCLKISSDCKKILSALCEGFTCIFCVFLKLSWYIQTSFTLKWMSHCWSRRCFSGDREVVEELVQKALGNIQKQLRWPAGCSCGPNFDAPEGNFLQISHNNTSLLTASLTCFNATWQINFVLCFVPELTPFFFNRKGQVSLFYLLLCGQGLPPRLQSSLLHCRLNPSELCWRWL